MPSVYTDVTFTNAPQGGITANKLNLLRDDLSAAIGSGGGTVGPPGPIGPAGPAGMTWKGIWSTTLSYAVNDAVERGGSSYICRVANIGSDPASSSSTFTAGPTSPAAGSGSYAGISATQVYISQSGTLQSISMFLQAGSNILLGLYGDAGSNPGTLIASSAITLSVNGNNTLPVVGGPTISPGNYWLAMQCQTNVVGNSESSGALSAWNNVVPWTGTLPASWPVSSGGNWQFSIYATFSIGTNPWDLLAQEGSQGPQGVPGVSADPGTWTSLSLGSGWTAPTQAQYRVEVNGAVSTVYFRGMIQAAYSAMGTTVFTVPAGGRPSMTRSCVLGGAQDTGAPSDVASYLATVSSSGVCVIYFLCGAALTWADPTKTQQVYLSGLNYSL